MALSKDGSVHVTDERINTITALVGSLCSILFASVSLGNLIEGSFRWYQYVSVALYLGGLVNLFIMSTLHHAIHSTNRLNNILRTLDYTAIYWLIAGTFSAVVSFQFETSRGLAVVVATWLLASAGIALRASLPSRLPKHINNTLFIALGWLPALVLLADLPTLKTTELILLVSGGLLYSLGFVVYVKEKPNLYPGIFGFHELWHIFVVLAAITHWFLINSFLR